MNRTLTCLMMLMMAVFSCSSAYAQVQYGVPKNAQDVGIDPHIGDTFPTNLRFINERGEPVQLAKIVDGTLPVFVTLNYSNCPGLCIAQLGNLTKAINELDGMQLGKDFRLVSISIDPSETNERLAITKSRYTSELDSQHDATGWYFLRGDLKSITELAKSVGFRYSYDEESGQFNHAAAAIGISPKGIITRYIYDLAVGGATLRLALIETSEGKLGTIGDQLLLWCYHFDENDNRYVTSARRLMSIGAGTFVVLVLAGTVPFWLRGRARSGAGRNPMNNRSDENPTGTK